ncbi:hypothetical protein [Vibrio aphrogenes]|uniref:hypothetical protein n=1 Tax=Vibrio aphrogenes TaxID=1891186 RepID=UPI000B3553B3|nr:hypothetical protein [Vibrio aphrogenes]
MDNYDDLARFKYKTNSQSIDFKDFFIENLKYEVGDNQILNQLCQKESNASPFDKATHTSKIAMRSMKKNALHKELNVSKEMSLANSVDSATLPSTHYEHRSYSLIDDFSAMMTSQLITKETQEYDSHEEIHSLNEHSKIESNKVPEQDILLDDLFKRISSCR